MSNSDQIQRFLFDQSNIRGELVGLDHAYREVLTKHNYPKPVQKLLGEFLAAAALLANTLKFEGTLTLQVKGSGQVRALMAECEHKTNLRGIARYNDDYSDDQAALGEGHLAITLDPDKGQRYQGIVAFSDQEGLAKALEGYFLQSEQINTRIWLEADCHKAAGMMLQAMPHSAETSSLNIDDDIWNRVTAIAETITQDEILNLDNENILTRLFHEETVRVFENQALNFHCNCSRERSANAILHIGQEEARKLLHEMGGQLSVDCQFCFQHYGFDEADINKLFAEKGEPLN